MRLFVAVNLPADQRRALARGTAGMREAGLPVRWAAEDGLHLTLKFLGEVAEPAAAEIGEVLAGAVAGARPFEVHLGGVGAFPTLERPRVIWLGVEVHPALELLANDVERALEPWGFGSELKPFRPHLTLGRVKKGARRSALGPLAGLAAAVDYAAALVVESVDLMQSRLGPRGATYAVVRRAPLAGAAAVSGGRDRPPGG